MEEEWRIYLRDTNPRLYEEMVGSLRWEAEWRDELISELWNEIAELKKQTKPINTGTATRRLTDDEIRDLFLRETGFDLSDLDAAILDFAHAIMDKMEGK